MLKSPHIHLYLFLYAVNLSTFLEWKAFIYHVKHNFDSQLAQRSIAQR